MFTRECAGYEHLRKGGEGSRMSHYDTGAIASANLMWKLWSANGLSKLHCVGLRRLSLYIPSISHWMSTPSPRGMTLGKVTLCS